MHRPKAIPVIEPTTPAASPTATVAHGLQATVETAFDEAAAFELWQHAETARVFNHPAWWSSALSAIGADRPLRVIRIVQGETTVALWPLWLKRLGAKELYARILEPVGARVTDYCLPLLRQGVPPEQLLRMLVETATRTLDAQTLLLLPKYPVDGICDVAVEDAAQAIGLRCATTVRPCPSMSLPADYGQLTRRWSKSHRGDVRRQQRRLEQAGHLELITHRNRDGVREMLPRLFAMHTANWRARAGSTDLDAGPMTEFVTILADRMPLELIEASEVRLDGTAIACHFGFREPGRLLWYKPTFDVIWANYAPGKVHIALAARRSIDEGLRQFDFMQGNEPYKRLWSDLTTETKSFALARPMAYPMWAWNTSVRKFVAEYRL